MGITTGESLLQTKACSGLSWELPDPDLSTMQTSLRLARTPAHRSAEFNPIANQTFTSFGVASLSSDRRKLASPDGPSADAVHRISEEETSVDRTPETL